MTDQTDTARRERYEQAIHAAGDTAYGNQPFYEAITDAVLAVADAEMEQLRRDRDLAIAHDRQPYPTAWAYEQACKALHEHRERADVAEEHRLALSEALGLGTGAPWDAIRERVAAVLPAAVGRAAVLREEATRIRAHCPDHLDSDSAPGAWMACHCDVADDMLRRLAEAQQDGPPPVHLGGHADAELCPACKAERRNLPYPFLCPAETGAVAREATPSCNARTDHLLRRAARALGAPRPPHVSESTEDCCGAEPPTRADDPNSQWGDCWCTLPVGHEGDHQCQPCTDRNGAPGWTDATAGAGQPETDEEADLTARLERGRTQLLEAMSGVSEERTCAGWCGDWARTLHAEGGIWETLGRAVGWPTGEYERWAWMSWDEAGALYASSATPPR